MKLIISKDRQFSQKESDKFC